MLLAEFSTSPSPPSSGTGTGVLFTDCVGVVPSGCGVVTAGVVTGAVVGSVTFETVVAPAVVFAASVGFVATTA